MAEWRVGRGWTDAELRRHLAGAEGRNLNFDIGEGFTLDRGWSRHASRAVIAREQAGPPTSGGGFERAWDLVQQYAFSDPRIVKAHFDPSAALLGRLMLLEIRVLGLRYLCSSVVGAVRDEQDERRSVRGYRYDTLAGHIERGSEWFLVTKDHATGDVTFTIRAAWKSGELPNFWSRIGFYLLARRYQRAWHRLAHLRLRDMLGSAGLEPLPRADRLVRDTWIPLIAASRVGGAGRPDGTIAAERDEKGRGQEGKAMAELTGAFGFGLICGARSMMGPALLSQAFATPSGLLAGNGAMAGLLTSPRAVQLLPLAAAAEIVADKLPWTPPRTNLLPLVGRVGSGALAGAAIGSRENRGAAVLAGAAGALAGTFLWYHTRRAATRSGLTGWLAGLGEDALALGLGLLILHGLDKRTQ